MKNARNDLYYKIEGVHDISWMDGWMDDMSDGNS